MISQVMALSVGHQSGQNQNFVTGNQIDILGVDFSSSRGAVLALLVIGFLAYIAISHSHLQRTGKGPRRIKRSKSRRKRRR